VLDGVQGAEGRCHGNHFLDFYIWDAHWCHLANATKPSVCGGDAASCQITLTSCYDRTQEVSQYAELPALYYAVTQDDCRPLLYFSYGFFMLFVLKQRKTFPLPSCVLSVLCVLFYKHHQLYRPYRSSYTFQ